MLHIFGKFMILKLKANLTIQKHGIKNKTMRKHSTKWYVSKGKNVIIQHSYNKIYKYITTNKVNLHIYYMSTISIYKYWKQKLTVETSNTKSPYGTDKESGGEVVAKFESTKLLPVCNVCNLVSSNIYYLWTLCCWFTHC